MGNLTRHFNREEFDCPCCGTNNIDDTLVKYIEIIRNEVNVPISIISGTRCEEHNRKVGGVPDSSSISEDTPPI